ncbi:ABC transporter transmembrane domain-containing protein, partial [Pseudomonas sp. DrBHI1]
MLGIFVRLLGADAVFLRRYLRLALVYGVLCGLTIVTLVPILRHLLGNQLGAAGQWLALLALGVVVCWYLRRRVEKAGIAVGIAVLRGGRQRLGEHVGTLPVGWFSAANTARLSHVTTQGMMEIAQLPAHVFTPLFTGVVTPLVILVALLLVDLRLGLVALVSLPLLALVMLATMHLGQRADQRYQRDTAQTSQRMVEFAQAQSVLRAFNGEQGGTRFLEQAVAQQQQAARKLIQLSALSSVLNVWAVQASFAALLVTATLWLGEQAGAAFDSAAVIATLVALVLATRFIDPLLDVAGYSE